MSALRPLAVMLLALALAGCAWRANDRCYLPMERYRPMKAVFLETGSMQRVEQLMEEEQWLECERRQMRYMLAKDLHLEELAETVPPSALVE